MMASDNHLANEPSPYLKQHAADPVAWRPWGADAFAEAQRLDRPIFLSIGYSTCHWCHVMARESFRDPGTAELLNEQFVSVKVDREERPDVDAVYLAAVQVMTGTGGWPLSVFLTPAGRPFYGGTYFPPEDRPGMPGFRRVLRSLSEAWRERRADVEAAADDLTHALTRLSVPPTSPAPGGSDSEGVGALRSAAVERLLELEDEVHGGFGGAPKFPSHEAITLLLADDAPEARAVALRALDAMGASGLNDQLGGGFFRYTVDAAWRVPHFEKMLYDNAAMLRNYARAATLTGESRYERWAHATAGWLRREMRSQGGAFFTALDAESGGVEGQYYLWTQDEVRDALRSDFDDEEVELIASAYGVGVSGPVDGRSVPRLAHGGQAAPGRLARLLEDARPLLLARRDERPRPATDRKVLTSWNGLLVRALAEAGVDLRSEELTALATAAAADLRSCLWLDGRLWHSLAEGEPRVEGLLEDYAYLGLGLLALYRATFDPAVLEWAFELADQVSARFHDEENGGYFNTAADGEELLVRPKGFTDAATPSENAAAAELVWWAARYRSDPGGEEEARRAVDPLLAAAAREPLALASTLGLALLQAEPPREVVLVGPPDSGELERMCEAARALAPRGTVLLRVDGEATALLNLPLLEGRTGAVTGAAEAYACEGGACRLPVRSAAELAQLLG